MGFLIGVDVGSQSVKAWCSTTRGGVVRCTTPPAAAAPASGWAEQTRGTGSALATAVRAPRAGRRPGQDRTLGLACQVDGVVAVDARHRPLRPDHLAGSPRAAADGRAGDRRRRRAVVRLTGLNPDASHSGPKVMWLRDNEPDVYARTGGWPGRRLPRRLAHRRARPGSCQCVVDPALRPRAARLVEARRGGRSRPAPCSADRVRACVVGTLRPEPRETRPSGPAASWSAPATTTAPLSAPGPSVPGSSST